MIVLLLRTSDRLDIPSRMFLLWFSIVRGSPLFNRAFPPRATMMCCLSCADADADADDESILEQAKLIGVGCKMLLTMGRQTLGSDELSRNIFESVLRE